MEPGLEADFDAEMMGIYQRALKETGYKASRFLDMLHEHRGLQTARMLIHSANVSDGYTALWERGRLDLTIEAVILENPRWYPLFNNEELTICRKRLIDYGYINQ